MIELESMAVEMPEVEGHPNRAPFRGVLTVVDVASQRAPSGSRGHRVVLTKRAAEEALPSLVGMALDYTPTYDRHDQRRKVGVITSAEIVGRNLEVGGYLYAKDFPEIVEEIAKWGGKGRLSAVHGQRSGRPSTTEGTGGRRGSQSLPSSTSSGQAFSRKEGARNGAAAPDFDCPSMTRLQNPHPVSPKQGKTRVGQPQAIVAAVAAPGEGARLRARMAAAMARLRGLTRRRAGDCGLQAGAAGLGMSFEVADVTVMDTRAQVWVLTKVTFTGAAILRRDKAAYEETWIELS